MPRYVALLRGINVGGKNPIPMPALKACFEDAGFEDVGTYIQSGNVVFTGPSSSQAALTDRVERTIRKAFAHYEASVVVKSRSQMRAVVDKAPKGFGRGAGEVPLRRVLPEAVRHGEAGGGQPPDEGGRGPDLGRQRRRLLLEAHEPSDVEPPEPGGLAAGLPADDDPELEHDDEAAELLDADDRLRFRRTRRGHGRGSQFPPESTTHTRSPGETSNAPDRRAANAAAPPGSTIKRASSQSARCASLI